MPSKKEESIVDLDQAVLNALDVFCKVKPPVVNPKEFKRPLVVGSVNAAFTGRIIFRSADALFADESSYKELLKGCEVDGAVLISASGAKSAPGIAEYLKKKGIHVTLWTNNNEAPAMKYADETKFFPKVPEPYTYNTSTYLGMILGSTGENPAKIKEYIQKTVAPRIPDMSKHKAFFLIIPNNFSLIKDMLQTKFDELFGPIVSARIFTPEQTMHAKTVIRSDTEFFLSFGYENKMWGTARAEIPLPSWADYGTMMAVGYYVIGHIQKQHPPYFKRSIDTYVKFQNKLFNQDSGVIVR